jgi:mannose-6-phosphate isomerase-like protein (cupin superfamily)
MDSLSRELSRELSTEILKELNPELPSPITLHKNSGTDVSSHSNHAHSDHWSAAILLERADYLRKLAKHSDGSASETLKEYPQHSTMLSFRSRDGVAELHEHFADVFYVLDGHATLLSGGSLLGAETISPGEMRGGSIEGGTRQELRAGDVAHVPAGVPHRMLVPGEQTLTCFVVKIQANA